MERCQYIELSELQEIIRGRIGYVERWVRVEIESHRVSGGHHYLNVLEKGPRGEIAAKASARIWRSNAAILGEFKRVTGKDLEPGITVVVNATVDYHPQYGLSLTINDIDLDFSAGQRELEKQETIRRLTEEDLIERQKGLELPFLPTSIALITSKDAAGYGDFMKHISCNQYGFKYNCTLFQSLVQGENAPSSIVSCLKSIEAAGCYDVVMILRGGGAESDMFCFDDYSLCRAIALCPVPVLTAIGHERDFHIADMVAHDFFKTPTALADNLIDWSLSVESLVTDALTSLQNALRERIQNMEREIERSVSTIRFALSSAISLMDKNLALLEAGIAAADPRSILSQGYVLAVDKDGTILKRAGSKSAGEEFALRFGDGLWDCSINNVKLSDDD